MPRVLIPLAPGVEELEAIAAVDILRRAGCHVVTASVEAPNPIVGRNRIRLLADIDLKDALLEWESDWDLVLLPGGLRGVETLAASGDLMSLLESRVQSERPLAAICAAPLLLVQAGVDTNLNLTCHPGVVDTLLARSASQAIREDAVFQDGYVITSRGAGTAVDFALACVEALLGATARREVEAEIALEAVES